MSSSTNTPQSAESNDGNSRCQWITGTDACKHFVRSWTVDSRSEKAAILYLHGIEGHSLWFKDTAEFLQSQGVTVHAVDRRGSGRSEGPRGDVNNFQVLIDDAAEALRFVRRSSTAPLFLMANCWGAKLAAILASSEHPCANDLSGLILSSPAISVKVDLTLAQKFSIAWRLISGNRTPYNIPLVPEDFTDNPHFLQFIRDDKLRLLEGTAQFFFNGQILTMLSRRAAKKIVLPTLIVQAGTDSIVEHSGIDKWFAELASKDKEIQIFPGVYHSLDFDKDPSVYRQRMLNWILARSIANAGDAAINSNNKGAKNRENSLA